MSNELAKIEKSKAVATISHPDPLTAYADDVSPRSILGKLLKFSKGDWLAGDQEAPVGTKMTVAVDELVSGWIKWVDKKRADTRMVRIADGVKPPKRGELDDFNTDTWPKDKDGKPQDPWSRTDYLPLMDSQGELYTFATSSWGGRQAIADLLRRTTEHRRRHPDQFPLVSLEVRVEEHKEFGRLKKPDLAPAGWEPKERFRKALSEAGIFVIDEGDAPAADKFDDEIPF